MKDLHIPNKDGKAYLVWTTDTNMKEYVYEGDAVKLTMSGSTGPQIFEGIISTIFRDDDGGFVLKIDKFPYTIVMPIEGVLDIIVTCRK